MASSSAASVWTKVFRSKLFTRYLLVTNTVSCGALMGLGDIAMQNLENLKTKQPHDWKRTGRMMCMGIVMGPFNHYWYTFLDKILPGATSLTVGKKILLDQIIASPYFAFSFFMGMGTLEGKPVNESFGEFRSKFWTVYKADWSFWPAAQAVNFYFLPSQARVVYVGFVTFCWNTFLSYMKHKDQQHNSGVLQTETKKDLI